MIPITRPELPPLQDYVKLLEQIWSSRMLSNFGTFAQLFEQRSQAYLGTPRVRAVVSGDTGLVLALAALDLPPGGEAIVPSFTFNSTINAVLWNRLVPVFADVDPDALTVPASEVERLAGKKTCVVLATHTFGNPCDADALRSAASARRLPIVYDAAHAFGSRYRGRFAGTLGDLEVFSFSGTKLVTSAEGGLVAAASDALIERIEYLRGYGFLGDYETHWPGLNGKLSELHAALGALTVEMAERAVARREALAAHYRERLADVGEISFQRIDPRDRSTYKDFALLCAKDRDGLEAKLKDGGVQTKRYFRPAHAMRAYRGYARGALAVTESVAARVLCVPMYNELAMDDVDRIADIVRLHYRGRRG
jgi:dTDP-4-amino-4,6-dideoxygalactose transaminase